MEQLAVKIAELLDITLEAAIELYPVLRGQYIWYVIFGNVITFGMVALVLSLCIFLIVGFLYSLGKKDAYSESDKKTVETFRKITKTALVVMISCVVIVLLANALRMVTATDIHLLMRLL